MNTRSILYTFVFVCFSGFPVFVSAAAGTSAVIVLNCAGAQLCKVQVSASAPNPFDLYDGTVTCERDMAQQFPSKNYSDTFPSGTYGKTHTASVFNTNSGVWCSKPVTFFQNNSGTLIVEDVGSACCTLGCLPPGGGPSW